MDTCPKRESAGEKGYILFAIVLLLALAGMIMSSSLLQTATGIRTVNNSKVRTRAFVQAEGSIAHAVSWLRKHSQEMVTPFRRDEFYAKMTRVSAAAAANEGSGFGLPSAIRLAGTDNAVILTNNSSLGSAAFPATVDLTTNTTFDAVSSFSSSEMGLAKVRITLLDAIAKIPSKDYGSSSPAPETDFYPIYRIDSMSDVDEGAHVSMIITGKVVNIFDMGFYGQNYLELRQSCDSYKSGDGAYSSGSKQANCTVGSNSTAALHKQEEVYGSIKTNGSITSNPPFGGEACADFVSGCPNKGETCTGEDCGVPLLEQYKAWEVYCPTNQGDLTITSTVTLTVDSNDPSDRCWNTVTIGNGGKLILTTGTIPYYFKTLNFSHNSAKFEAAPGTADGKIEIYTNTITGNSLNGNQTINTGGKPSQLILHYLGTDALTLNGTAAIKAAIVAPNASVTVSGSFEYYGALLAKQLTLTGSGSVHYDEDLGGSGAITNVQYRVNQQTQLYR